MTDKAEILELYRAMVDTITANELRRQQINSVFIALLAAGSGAVGAIENFDLIYVTVPAALISLVWWFKIRYLKQLAQAKFHVIGELEKTLSYRPFEEEWRFLKRTDECKPSWFQNYLRPGLSNIEMMVPVLVFIASIAHIGYEVWCNFGGPT